MPNLDTIQHEFLSKPDYGFLRVQLQREQTICVEASAMASLDTNVSMKTKMKGGLMAGLGRKLAGESMFINEFTAEAGPGEICIAPGAPGDIEHFRVTEGRGLFLQSSGYMASAPEVQINTKWGGFKGFFGGTGLFLLKMSGQGDVFFSAYGGILEIDVVENYVVDSGYVVAFEDSLEYKVRFMQGLKTALLGGEGLVCEFRGQGRVWIQTRKLMPLIWWVWPFRPKKAKRR